MILTSEERAEHLYGAMGQSVEISGGSAANTVVASPRSGGHGGLFRQGEGDETRPDFYSATSRAGRALPDEAAGERSVPPARSFHLDHTGGERTMNTYLGHAPARPGDMLEDEVVRAAAITYMRLSLGRRRQGRLPQAAGIAHKGRAARGDHPAMVPFASTASGRSSCS